ncbi:MAG: thrombospondin type 3 repeat-containing protein, partial [Thaumarchaeota archaeon]|nr:thrombospondin type 3 repeat-containing protein [Nitrososphaerota archaeon]
MRSYWALLVAVTLVASAPAGALAQYGDSDIDSDGVPNAIDSCPHVREDFEGEIDGCPSDFVQWQDSDADGIEDRVDECPAARETYNRHLDGDGCPDRAPDTGRSVTVDTDGDGVIDMLDVCPT